ncbi:bifunctional methionine sulfoxide reductase B/A protein [Limibacter armeniacum]|uniref:bifunctional methionine sulfoxide reductase B/A protein n=1 Tax=Limibacter armeniacum TaxID=466084 RepID=UPI002FE62423
MKRNKLTEEEARVILQKGTEMPFTGEYNDYTASGTYVCRQCEAPLYYSEDKFNSGCGWPSFDEEIPGAVRRIQDPDGKRTEIVCRSCDGHLGHVFEGEQYTQKNTRHCINSISLKFVPDKKLTAEAEKVYFACGCYWGKEYKFKHTEGVLATRVGFMGGHQEFPTYVQVCRKVTGHAETVEVTYSPEAISFEELLEVFFNMHNPTADDRQGLRNSGNYRSAIFYTTELQKVKSEQKVELMIKEGVNVVTQMAPAGVFYPADERHQNYCEKKGIVPK